MRPSAFVSFCAATVFYAGSLVSAVMLMQHRVASARLVHMIGTMGILVWIVNHALHVRHATRRLPPYAGVYVAAATLSVFATAVAFLSHTGDGVPVWWFADTVLGGGLVCWVEMARMLRGRHAAAAAKGT